MMQLPDKGWRVYVSNWDARVPSGESQWPGQEEFRGGVKAEGLQAS